MKKLIVAILVASMLLCVAACKTTGGNDSSSSSGTTVDSSSSSSGGGTEIPPETLDITPKAAQIDVNGANKDIEFNVVYGEGLFEGLYLNGEKVSETLYSRRASKLVLPYSYLSGFSAGEYEFELRTDTETVLFKVTVINDGINFTDENRVKEFNGEDIAFSVDYGGKDLSAFINGEAMQKTDFAFENGVFIVKKEYLNTLKCGAYEIKIEAAGDAVKCYIVKGFTADELFVLDYDVFKGEMNGYGQDLTVSEEVDGINGISGRVVCEGSGTLIHFGEENIVYPFKDGKKYTLSMKMKINSVVVGSSSILDLFMPIYFNREAGNNYDIGYLRYNESGLYFTTESGCRDYSLKEENGIWNFSCEFVYNAQTPELEIPVWMKSDIIVDDIMVVPAIREVVSSVSETFDEKIPEKGFGFGCEKSLKVISEGNNALNLKNTKSATAMVIGGEFYPFDFEVGATYAFSFDIRFNELDTTNFVIADNNCYMPVTFGSGRDVAFIRVTKTENKITLLNESQTLGDNSSVTKGENGFYTLYFEFTPTAECVSLTFDIWMASDVDIDNVTLIKK